MFGHARKLIAVLIATSALAALASAPAQAAVKVKVQGNTLVVTGSSTGEAIRTQVNDQGRLGVNGDCPSWRTTLCFDRKALTQVSPGPGCTQAGIARVTCNRAGITQASIDMKAGQDSVINRLDIPAGIVGGAGPDDLDGSDVSDWISGGDGRDWIDGRGGRDVLAGGGDVDTITSAFDVIPKSFVLWPDVVDCGPGADSAQPNSIVFVDSVVNCETVDWRANPSPWVL